MKSLIELWRVVAFELAAICHTSARRDLLTVSARCRSEGLSFLTITLPAFGAAFQQALDSGQLEPSSFEGFAFKGCLPRFLGGFTGLVFDAETGVLLDEPSVEAIYSIRQLTLMFGKMLLDCTDKRTEKALDRFIECEQEVRKADQSMVPFLWDFSKGCPSCSGPTFFPQWTKMSTTVESFPNTALVPLLINLRETVSLSRQNGPSGSRRCSLVGSISFQVGDTISVLTVCSSWILGRNDL